jgi:fatty acid desaturase
LDCRCFSFCHFAMLKWRQSPITTLAFRSAEQFTCGRLDKIHIRVPQHTSTQEVYMLWTIFIVLIILWLLGFTLHIGGGLIHLLLVVGLILLVINLVGGRRSAI